MPRPIVRSFALFTALACTALPSIAHACWDGAAVSTEKVSISITDGASWSPEEARHWAKWVARIDALVPTGSRLDVFGGDATLCDAAGACIELGEGLTPFTIFEHTADGTHASGPSIAAARHLDVVPFTVQVAASHDLVAAEKLAARINANDLGLHGFFEAGGFPSTNDYAHVVESFGTDLVSYHVVVGAFLERSEADSALHVVQTELGLKGFVRRLEQSSISEEGC